VISFAALSLCRPKQARAYGASRRSQVVLSRCARDRRSGACIPPRAGACRPAFRANRVCACCVANSTSWEQSRPGKSARCPIQARGPGTLAGRLLLADSSTGRGLSGGDDGDAYAAAVDVDDRAVDELRFVGGEVYRCVCDRVPVPTKPSAIGLPGLAPERRRTAQLGGGQK
jgi:hypothetical protein